MQLHFIINKLFFVIYFKRYKMRLKLKIGVLSLTLLLFSLILYSCVDEPYIDPAVQPFSEIKVLNLSHNVPNMKVLIDGQQPVASLNVMAIPSTTEYFDVKSGDRRFDIYDEAGNLIFSKELEITAFERMQIIFAGEYDPDPLLTTFSEIRIFEGVNYVDHSPAPGTSNITFIHAAAPYDTVTEREYTGITALAPASATDPTQVLKTYVDPAIDGAFGFEDVLEIDSAYAGQYDFTFTTESSGSVNYTTTFSSDKRGYVYLFGRPEAVEFFSYEITTPPARQRN
jgi:hypothetical protein